MKIQSMEKILNENGFSERPLWTKDFTETLVHCVYCGEKNVVQEEGDGDYYTGEMFLCLACTNSFTYQLGSRHTLKIEETTKE